MRVCTIGGLLMAAATIVACESSTGPAVTDEGGAPAADVAGAIDDVADPADDEPDVLGADDIDTAEDVAAAVEDVAAAADDVAEAPDDASLEPEPEVEVAVEVDTGPPPPDPCLLEEGLLDRLDPARMLADMEHLVGLGERASPEGQQLALDYVEGQLQELPGVEVSFHDYSWSGLQWQNLVADIPGTDPAEPWVLAGAHVDATSEMPLIASPGADDNASGVATLIEIARVLESCPPERSIRLLFFTNEEHGTIGSIAYVDDLPAELPPSEVLVYVNVDMIAFGPDDEDLDLATRPAYADLLQTASAAVTEWTDLDVREIIDDHCG